jgi:hypothetical protein
MRWRSWSRHCATSRKVPGSIPDGVIGIFHRHNHSSQTMALGPTRPLNRNIFRGVKGKGLITLPPSCAECLETGSLNLVELSRPVQGLLYPLLRHKTFMYSVNGLEWQLYIIQKIPSYPPK